MEKNEKIKMNQISLKKTNQVIQKAITGRTSF